MRRRVPLRSRGSVPVRLAPLEPLRGELVRGEAARPWREAARDHDRLLPVPGLVVRHDSADDGVCLRVVERKNMNDEDPKKKTHLESQIYGFHKLLTNA